MFFSVVFFGSKPTSPCQNDRASIYQGSERVEREYSRGSQRDVIYLGWPIEPSYMNPNAGEGGGGRLQGLSQWVQLYTWSPNKLWRSNSIFISWSKVKEEAQRHFAVYYWGQCPPFPPFSCYGQPRGSLPVLSLPLPSLCVAYRACLSFQLTWEWGDGKGPK